MCEIIFFPKRCDNYDWLYENGENPRPSAADLREHGVIVFPKRTPLDRLTDQAYNTEHDLQEFTDETTGEAPLKCLIRKLYAAEREAIEAKED